MSKIYANFSCLLAMIAATSAAAADDNIVELEEVVVTSPMQDKASDFSMPVTVLSDEEYGGLIGGVLGKAGLF